MSASTAAHPPLWRRGVMSEPGYPRYFVAMFQGATGYWVSRIAQDWLLLELTGNVTWVGIASAMQFGPMLLFGLWGGVLADKINVRKLLAGAQLLQASGSVFIATMALLGLARPWMVVLAAGIAGISSVFEQPARSSMITQLSGRHLSQGLSLNSIAFQVAGFLGAPLAAFIVASVGPGLAFALNALGCTVTASLLFNAPTADPDPAKRSQVTLKAGLASIKETTEIGWTMVLLAAVSLLALAMSLVYVDMANNVFGIGVQGYSLFNSITAVGCIIGSLVAGRTRGKSRLRHLVAMLLIGSACLFAGSLSPNPWVYGAITMVQFVVVTMFQLLSTALVQMSVQPEARGRVMGLYLLIAFGGMSVSQPLVGMLVDALGGRRAQQTLALLLLLCTLASAAAIGRFTGQRLTVHPRRGVRIAEPLVPRHVRLAERDLAATEHLLQRTQTTLHRGESFRQVASATSAPHLSDLDDLLWDAPRDVAPTSDPNEGPERS